MFSFQLAFSDHHLASQLTGATPPSPSGDPSPTARSMSAGKPVFPKFNANISKIDLKIKH